MEFLCDLQYTFLFGAVASILLGKKYLWGMDVDAGICHLSVHSVVIITDAVPDGCEM